MYDNTNIPRPLYFVFYSFKTIKRLVYRSGNPTLCLLNYQQKTPVIKKQRRVIQNPWKTKTATGRSKVFIGGVGVYLFLDTLYLTLEDWAGFDIKGYLITGMADG